MNTLLIKLHIFYMFILIFSSINWTTHAFGYNMIEFLTNFIHKTFKINYPINKLIYILIGLTGISMAFNRDIWLPFLSKTVIPISIINNKIPLNADTKISISVKPNSKIIYWAANNNEKDLNVNLAYGNYENAGVAMSDKLGRAELYFANSNRYILPNGKYLNKHVHYRVFESNNILGDVKTIFY